ncbi:hypothetical protein SAMN04488126_12246, partial [Bhargavaea beijingensis]
MPERQRVFRLELLTERICHMGCGFAVWGAGLPYGMRICSMGRGFAVWDAGLPYGLRVCRMGCGFA